MSFQAIQHVISNSGSSGTERLVLLIIAYHADANGQNSYPSRATIAEECGGMDERYIKRLLRKLEDANEIIVEINASPVGSNLYTIPGMTQKNTETQPAEDYAQGGSIDPLRVAKGGVDMPPPGGSIGSEGGVHEFNGGGPEVHKGGSISPPNSTEYNNNDPIEDPSPRSRSTDTDFAEFCQITENAGFGVMTPFLTSQLNDWMDEYSTAWIHQAFEIAIKRNKRSYSYINGILKNMRSDGPKEQRNGTTNSAGYYTGPDTSRRDHACWHTEAFKRSLKQSSYGDFSDVRTEDITF